MVFSASKATLRFWNFNPSLSQLGDIIYLKTSANIPIAVHNGIKGGISKPAVTPGRGEHRGCRAMARNGVARVDEGTVIQE